MTIDWLTDPALPCWRCDSPCWVGNPITRPNGDVLVITVCDVCWTVNDFINGQPVRVVFMPAGRKLGITRGTTVGKSGAQGRNPSDPEPGE